MSRRTDSEGAFTKLMHSLPTSSMWTEDSDTRIVWITMLSMADSTGYVGSSIPGLARIANVSLEATERALAKFMAPDPYSRSEEREGRRILVADRGWILVNYTKFREMVDVDDQRRKNAIRQADKRARDKADESRGVTEPSREKRDNHAGSPEVWQGEGEGEGEEDPEGEVGRGPTPLALVSPGPKPRKAKPRAPADPAALALATALVDEINRLKGGAYSPRAKVTLDLAAKLAEEGRTPEEAVAVARYKHAAIKTDADREFFVPATLLRHFDETLDRLRGDPRHASRVAAATPLTAEQQQERHDREVASTTARLAAQGIRARVAALPGATSCDLSVPPALPSPQGPKAPQIASQAPLARSESGAADQAAPIGEVAR